MSLFDNLFSVGSKESLSPFSKTCCNCGKKINNPLQGDVCVSCDKWVCLQCVKYQHQGGGPDGEIPFCPSCYY